MADLYTNSKYNTDGSIVVPGRMLDPWEIGGRVNMAKETFEIAVADAAADIKRIFKARDPNEIPIAISFAGDGIAGMNQCDLGLFKTNLGTVVDADCLANDIDLSNRLAFSFAPRQHKLVIPFRDADETLGDAFTYKGIFTPGVAAKLVQADLVFITPTGDGTNTIKINNGTSAGNTMLGAASYDFDTAGIGGAAGVVIQIPLTATAADLLITKAQGVYVELVTGTTTVDPVGGTLTLTFEEQCHGLNAVAIENIGKQRLFELAGHSIAGGNIPAGGYDIGLTLVSEPTAAGTIAVQYWYMQG